MLFRGILLLALLVFAAVLVSRFRRRRWQFNMRWVLGVTLLLCLPLGWYAAQVRRVALEQEAVDHITDIGGFARFDDQLGDDDRGFPGNLVPKAPRWLRELLGERLFSRVVQVRMARDTVTNKDLMWLQRLDGTRFLNLTDAAVSDEGLRNLRGLTHLEELILENTQVSVAGLKHLSHLKALGVLNLRGTRISDEGLVHLSPLKALGELNLRGTRISDEGLVHLEGLTNLYSLNLLDTDVTEKGIDKLQTALPKARLRQERAALLIGASGGTTDFNAGVPSWSVTSVTFGEDSDKTLLPLLKLFPNVSSLRLSGRTLADTDLVHIKTLSKLQYLSITCPGITGIGLRHMQSSKNLDFVGFASTSGLTDQGVQEIAGLKQVRWLRLEGSSVSGSGLAHLRAMTRLKTLQFNFAISDAGFESLAQLDQLEELSCPADVLTRDQWNTLRNALPNCDILGK